MRGFKLKIHGKEISGAIEVGITNIVLSCKENQFHLTFSSLDETGMISQVWYSSYLELGDRLSIIFDDTYGVSQPMEVRDYTNKDAMDRLLLQSYHRLREELVNEGLIHI